MGEFSITHLLLLAVIFLIFFGPSRLPALGQSLGKAIRGFKQGLNEIDLEAKDVSQQNQNQQQQVQNNQSQHLQQPNNNDQFAQQKQTDDQTHKKS